METEFLWFNAQSVVVISYRCFGTTYLYYIQVPRIQVVDS